MGKSQLFLEKVAAITTPIDNDKIETLLQEGKFILKLLQKRNQIKKVKE